MATRFVKDLPGWRRVDKVPQVHETRVYQGPSRYCDLADFLESLEKHVVGMTNPMIDIQGGQDSFGDAETTIELSGWVVKTEEELKEARKAYREQQIERDEYGKEHDRRLLETIRQRRPELFDD
jgi:hypothetical protein